MMSGGKIGEDAANAWAELLFGQCGSRAGVVDASTSRVVVLEVIQAVLAEEIGLE